MEYKKHLVTLAMCLASYSASAECEWSNPGGDKYMLPLALAVDKLEYIPEAARTALKRRLEDSRNYDDHILMTSTSVTGSLGSWSISDMNSGNGKVCKGLVTTKTWAPDHTERALVFCEKDWCLAYFSVYRNIAVATLVYSKKPDNFLAKANPIDPIEERLDFDARVDWVWKPEYAEVPNGDPYNPVEVNRYSYLQPYAYGIPVVSRYASASVPEIVVPVTPIPEPSTLLMLAGGLLFLLFKFKK